MTILCARLPICTTLGYLQGIAPRIRLYSAHGIMWRTLWKTRPYFCNRSAFLRDADILEQLGAMGVLRTICKVGRDTRFPTFTPAVEALQRALNTLPEAITLPTTKLAAEPRIQLLRSFLLELQSEAGENLY